LRTGELFKRAKTAWHKWARREKFSASLVGPQRKTELKLNCLLNDLRVDGRLSALGLAFTDKLFGVRLARGLCQRAAEECRSVYLREQAENRGVISGIGTVRAHASAHFESFLYFIVGAFDILASITRYFYPKHACTLTDRYFKDQMKNFIDNPSISPDLAGLLSKNRSWIEDVENNRDALAHKASVFLAFDPDGRLIFEKRKRYDDKEPFSQKPFEDLVQYLNATFEKLYTFLEEYVEIHRRQVPISEKSKLLLAALERGDILEYYYST
jgi:hypothetical protein